MKCSSLLSFTLALIASSSASAGVYDVYKSKVEQCIQLEEQKTPVGADDLRNLTPDEVVKYILVLKDIRIQRCSEKEELAALASEISSSENISPEAMRQKYLSVYIASQVSEFSHSDTSKLDDLDTQLKSKSLEGDLLAVMDQLKN